MSAASTSQDNAGALALRIARALLDASVFVIAAPVLVFVLGAVLLAVAVPIVALAELALPEAGLHLLRQGLVAPAREPLFWAFFLGGLAVSCGVVLVFAIARAGKRYGAILVLLLAPVLWIGIAAFVSIMTPYEQGSVGASLNTHRVLGGLLFAAPILSAVGAILVLASSFIDTDPLAKRRRSWPLLSLSLFLARHRGGGVRVWAALVTTLARMFASGVVALAIFILIGVSAFAGANVVDARVGFPYVEFQTIYSSTAMCCLTYFLIVLQCILGFVRRRGVAMIHLIVGVGAAAVVGEMGLFLLEMTADAQTPGRLAVLPISNSELALPAIFGLGFVVRGFLGKALIRGIDRVRSAAARTARDLSAMRSEPPILFFRSFADDEQSVPRSDAILLHALDAPSPKVRLEEIVARIMFARGPLLALANPDLRAAPIGAARDVLRHDDWQAAVIRYVDQAQIIVCFIGSTPSFLWEVGQIVERDKLRRTIFVLPPAGANVLEIGAPALAAALGEAVKSEPGGAARTLAFDASTQTFRIFRSRRADAFAYEQAILGAAALVTETIERDAA